MLKFGMQDYDLYDPVTKNHGIEYIDASTSFVDYNAHTLFIIPFALDATDILTEVSD